MPQISNQFDIGILVGDNTFHFMRNQKIRSADQYKTPKKIEGKIVDFAVDQQKDTGFYFLVKQKASKLPSIEKNSSIGSNLQGKIDHHDQSKNKMFLKVLVDKTISDLPNSFTESHEVAISMQLKDDSTFVDDKQFTIVIDAVDDDQ